MNHYRKILKRNILRKSVAIDEAATSFIQPFKEMPSINKIETDSEDRINAHELFSYYTANVIKQDIVYAR